MQQEDGMAASKNYRSVWNRSGVNTTLGWAGSLAVGAELAANTWQQPSI